MTRDPLSGCEQCVDGQFCSEECHDRAVVAASKRYQHPYGSALTMDGTRAA